MEDLSAAALLDTSGDPSQQNSTVYRTYVVALMVLPLLLEIAPTPTPTTIRVLLIIVHHVILDFRRTLMMTELLLVRYFLAHVIMVKVPYILVLLVGWKVSRVMYREPMFAVSATMVMNWKMANV
jgi:hypothetical protein